MVEECVVILGFSKDKTRNSSTPLTHKQHGQPNKTMPQKTKETKLEQGGSSSYFVE
jgi:hypothetical protein